MEKVEVIYNPINNRPIYKHFHSSFKKDTKDYHVGKDGLESWDRDSLTEYCTDHFDYILRNNDYSHVFQILKRFLRILGCNYRSEFEEKILKPILRKLCSKYDQDFEQVLKKIFENDCISYEENFK